MSDGQNPANRSTRSGIDVDKASGDLGLTATVSLSRKGMGLTNARPEKAAPPPPPAADAVKNLPYAVATKDDCGCPRCGSEFEIAPEFFNAVAECPECALMFVIKPPGTPPYRGVIAGKAEAKSAPEPADNMLNTIEMQREDPSARAARPAAPAAAARGRRPTATNMSGIDVDNRPKDYGLTATVTLSRRGMGMHQKRKNEAPPPPQAIASMPYAVATQDEVSCPKCSTTFEISPEFYNAVAECPECASEFIIKPPGTPAYKAQGSKVPVQTRASSSGPVPVPPGAQPAPQTPAPVPSAPASRPVPPRPAPAQRSAPAPAPARPAPAAPAPAAAPEAPVAKGRSGVAQPKRRTETSIKQIEQLTAAPAKKKPTKAILIGVISVVIILLVVVVVWLITWAI